MSENHDEQSTELTYPNNTNNTIWLVIYYSDQDQSPEIWWDNITITLVNQDFSSDKENNGRLMKTEEITGGGDHECHILPTNVTPPPLITSESLMISLKELLTLPAYLEYLLNQQNDDA